MKKWLLAIPAAALAGGYLGFRHACRRMEDPDWDSEEALKQTEYAEFAESIPRARQWLRDHGAQEVQIESFDGWPLRAQWVQAEKPMATIILFHGYHTHHIHDFAGIYGLYHALGLNLLLVRQRAHGESGGPYITFGVRERKDALSWIAYHNRVHGMDNVFLGGMSMGASTVLFAAGEDLPPNVRGITADCGFSSPADILSHIIHRSYHLPPRLVLPLMDIWAKLLGGFSFYECDSRKTLTRSKTPILFIHGKADRFVPCSMTEEGHRACASEKELYLVEGAGHGRSFLLDPEGLKKALTDFFRRNISEEFSLEDHT
jgi:fermentation-respiration switch protein FrsA (DUF1100 family)